MREPLAGRMLSLTGWMLAGLGAISGCQSTALSPKSLTRDAAASPAPAEVAWRKSASTPSTALAQDHWTNPPKTDEPVRTTAYQEPPPAKGDWMPPIPQVMLKDEAPPPLVVPTARPPLKHGGKHQGAPVLHAPNEGNPVALSAYIIRPADVLTIELLPQFTRDKKDQSVKSEKIGLNQPIYGPHPVHPDGTVSLGIYGPVLIAGKTIYEAREEVARTIFRRLNPETIEYKDVLNNLKMDIANYNNGFYYVIVNYAGAAGMGEVVERFPVTGTETVLDAISKLKGYGQPNLPGLPGMTSTSRIWVARANPGHMGPDNILPVDWKGISQHGAMATNWQIMPGDRVYLQAEAIRRFDNQLSKVISPIRNILGVAQQVNALRSSNSTNLVAP